MDKKFQPGTPVLIPAVVSNGGESYLLQQADRLRGPRQVVDVLEAAAIPDTRDQPNEVTEEMVRAGAKALETADPGCGARAIYLAMERARLSPSEPLRPGDRVKHPKWSGKFAIDKIEDGYVWFRNRHGLTCAGTISECVRVPDLTRLEASR